MAIFRRDRFGRFVQIKKVGRGSPKKQTKKSSLPSLKAERPFSNKLTKKAELSSLKKRRKKVEPPLLKKRMKKAELLPPKRQRKKVEPYLLKKRRKKVAPSPLNKRRKNVAPSPPNKRRKKVAPLPLKKRRKKVASPPPKKRRKKVALPPPKKRRKKVTPPPPKKRRKKAELPLVPVRSREAEVVVQAKLATLLGLIDMTEGGLDMAIQTFINGDGSVDGELRINRLPDRWRMPRGLPELIAALSSAFQTFPVFEKEPPFGGGFWVTFGVRFGPQNETEVGEMADLYKRFRGLFQIGTYPTPAWNLGPIQIAITDDKVGLRSMIRSLEAKRGIPPSSILIRFLWGPEWAYNSRLRPGHYKGEK